MVLLGGGTMKVYSPSETSELLGIKTATLRKYSLLLESNWYEIARNSKRYHYYWDKYISKKLAASTEQKEIEEPEEDEQTPKKWN